MLILHEMMGATISQISYLGLSYHFMKSTKLISENYQKFLVFHIK